MILTAKSANVFRMTLDLVPAFYRLASKWVADGTLDPNSTTEDPQSPDNWDCEMWRTLIKDADIDENAPEIDEAIKATSSTVKMIHFIAWTYAEKDYSRSLERYAVARKAMVDNLLTVLKITWAYLDEDTENSILNFLLENKFLTT